MRLCRVYIPGDDVNGLNLEVDRMKKIITISITAVVVIIVLAGVLMPVLDDATATEDTITNKGYYRMSSLAADSADTVVIQWDKATMADYLVVNDEHVKIKFPGSGLGCSLIFGDNWLFRAYGTDGVEFLTTQFYQNVGGTKVVTDFTLTCSAGAYNLTATVGGSETTTNGTYTTMYYPTNNGAYTMKYSDSPAYVFEDSEIIAFGLTNINGSDGVSTRSNVGYSLTGSIADGITITNWRVNSLSGDTLTHSTPVINKTDSDRWVDVYDLNKITFTTTATGEDPADTADTSVIYSYFLVPTEITGDRINHFTDGQNALFWAIPIMIIAALLVGVVALVIRTRAD